MRISRQWNKIIVLIFRVFQLESKEILVLIEAVFLTALGNGVGFLGDCDIMINELVGMI